MLLIAYVAFGVVSAVIVYYLPLNILIKILFIPLFGAGGIVIAFLPIEGRPVDVIVTNFLKAVFSPNQYVYQKVGRQFSFTNLPATKSSPVIQHQATGTTASQNKRQQLQAFLHTKANHPLNRLDEKEASFLNAVSQQITLQPTMPEPPAPPKPAPQQTPQPVPPSPTVTPTASHTTTAESLTKQEEALTHKLEEAKKEDDNPQTSLLERQVQALHFQRQQLEQQLQQLKAQLTTTQNVQQQEAQQRVHNIPKEQMKNARR